MALRPSWRRNLHRQCGPSCSGTNRIRGGRSAGCCSGRTARPARGGRDRPPPADSDLSKSGLGVAGAGWLTPDNLNPVRQETLNPRLLDLGCVPYWHAWVSLSHSDARIPSFLGSELAGSRAGGHALGPGGRHHGAAGLGGRCSGFGDHNDRVFPRGSRAR